MKQKLVQQPRLKQQLQLTIQVQQFLQIIQMPLPELTQYIQSELQQNPLLEEETQNEAPFQTIETLNNTYEKQNHDKFEDQLIKELYNPIREQYYQKQSEPSQIQLVSKTHWKNRLFDEIKLLLSTQEEQEIAANIIYNLSENGFLTIPIETLSSQLHYPLATVEKVLRTIQKNAQPGIAARNAHECLLLQIEREEGQNSLTYEIIKTSFIDLINQRYRKIAQKHHTSIKEVKNIATRLKKYYSHPIVEQHDNLYVIPEYEISIQDNSIIINKTSWKPPKLTINTTYLKILKQAQDKTTKEFLKNYMLKAKAIINAIKERDEKIQALLRFLCERQRDFVENGPGFLKPLTLKEAAKYIGLHESTISRLANNKYVQLPWGCIKIKDFFLNPLSYTNQTPRTLICQTIEEIINSTNTKKISDEFIRKKLLEHGIQISRRTVNKYRNLMKSKQLC